MKAEISGFLGKLNRLRMALPEARTQALRVMVFDGGTVLDREVARDTNRLGNGFAIAINQATRGQGGGIIRLRKIEPSRYAERRIEDLERQAERFGNQVRRWEAYKRSYEQQGRTKQKYYRQVILKNLDPNRRSTPAWLLKRALEELAKYDATRIVVYNARASRNLRVTVRTKSYGGRGRMLVRRDLSIAEMVNLEPHASIRGRTLARRAMRVGARIGVKQARRAMLKELAAGVGGGVVSVR